MVVGTAAQYARSTTKTATDSAPGYRNQEARRMEEKVWKLCKQGFALHLSVIVRLARH